MPKAFKLLNTRAWSDITVQKITLPVFLIIVASERRETLYQPQHWTTAAFTWLELLAICFLAELWQFSFLANQMIFMANQFSCSQGGGVAIAKLGFACIS